MSGEVTIQVKDAIENTADAKLAIVPALVISPSTRAIAVGSFLTFSATGGLPPYVFSVVNGEGAINTSTGAFSASQSVGSVSVQVKDALGNTARAYLVINPPLAISSSSPWTAVGSSVTFSATGGSPPYLYSVVEGGGTISSTSGLYTASSAKPVLVRATDSLTGVAEAAITVKELFSEPDFYYESNQPVMMISGDWNNDGNADIVVINNERILIFTGIGDGKFQSAKFHSAIGDPARIVKGDWNRDGNLDLAMTNTNHKVNMIFGRGDATFNDPIMLPGEEYVVDLIAGDWNGDGKLDLATLDYVSVRILVGVGDGTFLPPLFTATSGNPNALASGDLNVDGKLDIVLADDVTRVLLGRGDGTFQPLQEYPRDLPYVSCPHVAIADWNGDQKVDLVLACGAKTVVLKGSGDGTFPTKVEYPLLPSTTYAWADWNGDQKIDFVSSSSLRQDLLIFLGPAENAASSPLSFFGVYDPFEVITDDWNNDGKPDLAVTSPMQEGFNVLLNQSP